MRSIRSLLQHPEPHCVSLFRVFAGWLGWQHRLAGQWHWSGLNLSVLRFYPVWRRIALLLLALGIAPALPLGAQPVFAPIPPPVPLPALHVALADTSVSGLSSGGYMAVQFSVAYSSIIRGAGIIAGGPYYCARGRLDLATQQCSCTGLFAAFTCRVTPGGTQIAQLVAQTQRWAEDGRIDPVAGLARQRLWLFSGTLDSVVPPPVMQDLATYYRQFVPAAQIRFRAEVPAEHALPTADFGSACDSLGSPYLNDCNLDAAGELLRWIYGPLQAPQPDEAGNAGIAENAGTGSAGGAAGGGRLIAFDQTEFAPNGNAAALGLASNGYVYLPAACESARVTCRVHVAFHGCKQNVANVGQQFLREAGYNRWAATNRLIVLYPQTQAKSTNPNACWNWFDFDGNDPDYANQRGRQMRAIRAMIDRLAGLTQPPAVSLPRCFTASNREHVQNGRAYAWFLLARAKGSDDYLGFDNRFAVTTLRQTAPNFYQLGVCP